MEGRSLLPCGLRVAASIHLVTLQPPAACRRAAARRRPATGMLVRPVNMAILRTAGQGHRSRRRQRLCERVSASVHERVGPGDAVFPADSLPNRLYASR
jgi:hypothetical protein